ncbi:DUF222 domain-containing protein [Rhodococcus opacus]|uniref:DUF222 domain-containing protein n=1 Tax=Rhodococcus opacus TaxID=37919 RepID=UPI0026B3DD11
MFDTGVFDRGIRETVCCLVDEESDVGLVELMTDLHRSESVVAERKLAVIAELFVRRTAEVESDGAWTSTAHEVVEAEIGAALTMGRAAAGRLIGLGMSLRTRLHATREAMARGDLDMYWVRLIEDATVNVSDGQIGEVEHQLLEQVLAPPRSGGTGLTGRRLTNAANRIIARLDPAGVRAKREKAQADRFVGVSAAEDGMCRILGSIPAAQGRAFDARLRELANTVCSKDLRTYEQRRADGLSALIDGVGFVHCECGRVDCGQDSRIATTARKPLVHLIMLDSTLAGGDEPAYLDGYGIVDAAHAREIAADAEVEPVRAPNSVVPTTYRPGTVLDTWMRGAGRRVRMVALRCGGLEHGPRSSSAVRPFRSRGRRSDSGREHDCLLSKSSQAQTFRSLEGDRWRWNRVGHAHRSPIPTAVVGAPGCRK